MQVAWKHRKSCSQHHHQRASRKRECGQNGPRVGGGEPLYTSFHTHQKTADRATRMHAPSHHQWHHQHLEPDSSRQQMCKTNVEIPQTCSLLYTVTFNQSVTRRVWSPWHYGASIMCYVSSLCRSLQKPKGVLQVCLEWGCVSQMQHAPTQTLPFSKHVWMLRYFLQHAQFDQTSLCICMLTHYSSASSDTQVCKRTANASEHQFLSRTWRDGSKRQLI